MGKAGSTCSYRINNRSQKEEKLSQTNKKVLRSYYFIGSWRPIIGEIKAGREGIHIVSLYIWVHEFMAAAFTAWLGLKSS